MSWGPDVPVIGAQRARQRSDAPEVVGWETTLRCNMRCEHCGSTAGVAREKELTAEQSLDLCRQIADLGAPRVCLTGGETLMRKDWRSILDALLGHGLEVGILTNGWFSQRSLQDLVQYASAPVYVSISIDGMPQQHDRIRALDGSFDRATAVLRHLRDAGVHVAIVTTMSRANIDSLPALRKVVLEDLRPYCWQVQVTTPFGRARENNACSVGPVEYTRAVVFVCETRRMAQGTGTRIYAGDCLGYLSTLESGLRDRPWQGCHAGLDVVGIQSNGDVKGCLSIIDDSIIEGNVLDEGLEAIWRKPGAFAYTRDFTVDSLRGICAGCPVGEQCRGGCTASSISMYGEPSHAPYCVRVFEQTAAVGEKPEGRPVPGVSVG